VAKKPFPPKKGGKMNDKQVTSSKQEKGKIPIGKKKKKY